MSLNNEKNVINNLAKKIYLARLNILDYDTYYGYLLLNIKYIFDAKEETAIIKKKNEMHINPMFVVESELDEIEALLVSTMEKYLINIGVYDEEKKVNKDENKNEKKNENQEKSGNQLKGNTQGECESQKQNESQQECENQKQNVNQEKKSSQIESENQEKIEKQKKNKCEEEIEKYKDEFKHIKNIVHIGDIEHFGHFGHFGYEKSYSYYWKEKMYQAVRILKESKNHCIIPEKVYRVVEECENKKINWKEQLQDFMQYDIADYSFTPPDKRYDDLPFFLPDFNERIEKVENILFMVDTSFSMSDEVISKIYNEIKNCVMQFEDKIKGYVGCFDINVYNVTEFSNVNDLKSIRLYGGGGTNFCNIFNYINEEMKNIELKSVIILTDGYATFPDKNLVKDLPILWLITSKKVKPPIGKILYV